MSQTKVVSKQEIADFELAVYELSLQKEYIQRAKTAQCGTISGGAAHRRRKEETCRACRDAVNFYARSRWIKRPERPGPSPCGTNAGYHAHYKRKEPQCQPCKAAYSLARKVRREDKAKNIKRTAPPCGTVKGYWGLRCYKQNPCQKCRAVYREYRRNLAQKTK